MRVRVFKLLLVPAFLITPALADIMATVDITAGVGTICSDEANGANYAYAAITCDFNRVSFSGTAAAQTFGISPYGIGAAVTLQAQGLVLNGSGGQVDSTLLISSSEEFELEGAQGGGFMRIGLSGLCGNFPLGGYLRLSLFGATCNEFGAWWVNGNPTSLPYRSRSAFRSLPRCRVF
jgi:hypothetical protein